jgi:hypothetical protein
LKTSIKELSKSKNEEAADQALSEYKKDKEDRK